MCLPIKCLVTTPPTLVSVQTPQKIEISIFVEFSYFSDFCRPQMSTLKSKKVINTEVLICGRKKQEKYEN